MCVKREDKTDLSGEGHEVVLTEREDVNVTDNDHLIMVLGENCIINNIYNHSEEDKSFVCVPKEASWTR